MHVEMSDYQIARLIGTARFLLRQNKQYWDSRTTENLHEENPGFHWQFLMVKDIVKDAMRYRRQHRKTVAHIFKVYADSVIKAREKVNAGHSD